MKFGKFVYLAICCVLLVVSAVSSISAQTRDRVVRQGPSQPTDQTVTTSSTIPRPQSLASSRPVNQAQTQPSVVTRTASRPVLTNDPVVQRPLVQRTGSTSPLSMATAAATRISTYDASTSSRMMQSITSKLGIPYLYGSTGPNRYDCSGFIWAVFQDAGIDFERSSAKSLWEASVPVEGDERLRFGTLVFFNRLGHVGIVADKDGFYHASSSKGVTYSKFAGYWENRIVGFRRLPLLSAQSASPAEEFK